MPDALEYLAHPDKYPAAAVCVLYGDESFLKRQAIGQLRTSVLGNDDGDFSMVQFAGDQAALRDVLDELSTVAMFGAGKRLVVMNDADEFVTRYRPQLEDYVAKPKTSGVLVLEVNTWPSTTRLAKKVTETGLAIECKCPTASGLAKWLGQWAKRQHKVKLDAAAAESLMEAVEPELGILDQELAKLAALAGPDGTITAEMVDTAVKSWRTKTTWDMLDAALAGDAREALGQLERLLMGGEVPIAILAQIASNLRRLAAATRLITEGEAVGRRLSLRQALEAAGVKSFVLSKSEVQLKQLGRARAGKLYRWLLDADLALKGSSSLQPRFVLEQLIARMSRAAAVPAAGR